MSEHTVTIPEFRDLYFRMDRNCDEKVVFFTEEAIKRAVIEGRMPKEAGEELLEVLRRPGEIAAVIEWKGLKDWQQTQGKKSLFPEATLLSCGVNPLFRGH